MNAISFQQNVVSFNISVNDPALAVKVVKCFKNLSKKNIRKLQVLIANTCTRHVSLLSGQMRYSTTLISDDKVVSS